MVDSMLSETAAGNPLTMRCVSTDTRTSRCRWTIRLYGWSAHSCQRLGSFLMPEALSVVTLRRSIAHPGVFYR